ncbi:MAG: alpha/beta hydrolase [Symbiopectobacterium sp.]
MWIWRGFDPREIEEMLAQIMVSTAKRSNEHFLDTVVSYRSANWIYEWAKQQGSA